MRSINEAEHPQIAAPTLEHSAFRERLEKGVLVDWQEQRGMPVL